jgi:hypothetical protein
MADKRISELVAAEQVTHEDLFVLEQSGEAKKLTGKALEDWLINLSEKEELVESIAESVKETVIETIKETPTEVFPMPTEIEVAETANTATIVASYADGNQDTTTITFDGNGYATKLTFNGTDIPVDWTVT